MDPMGYIYIYMVSAPTKTYQYHFSMVFTLYVFFQNRKTVCYLVFTICVRIIIRSIPSMVKITCYLFGFRAFFHQDSPDLVLGSTPDVRRHMKVIFRDQLWLGLLARWWFHGFLFQLLPGVSWSNLTSTAYFSNGLVKNHQLAGLVSEIR